MIVAVIILWAVVLFELLLILGLARRLDHHDSYLKEINDFLAKYVEKNRKSNEKMSETIKVLADKVIELYKRF